MPRNGDGSNEDGEIEKLRSQVRTLEQRLAAFEKSEISSLKAHLKEHAEEKRRNEEGQREAAERTELVERQIKALNAILRTALKGRPLADCLTRTLGGQLSPYPFGLLPIESAHE